MAKIKLSPTAIVREAKRIKTTPSVLAVRSLKFKGKPDCERLVRFIKSSGEELSKISIPSKRDAKKLLGGCIGGGAPQTASIEYITILTAANADNFGNLTQSRSGIDSISGGARGIWANGQAPHRTTIDYVTISSTGDATDFGETTIARTFGCGASSDPGSGQNRGVFMAGYSGVDDHVDYITCNTAGNATDWGELNSSHSYRCAGGSDGSRGFCAGGAAGGSTISYLTIDTAGSSSNAGGLGTQGGNATGFTGA